jgi:hypothetical protein
MAVAATAFAVLAAACGGGGSKRAAAPPRPTTTSTTLAPTTTTTVPRVAPLTGLPQLNGVLMNRVALAIKIDNVDQARPQAGINQADIVFEEMVEGGLTRLIAVFQSGDASLVGPVRSTRTTDIDIVWALNDPLYGYSGGNAGFVALLRSARLVDVGYDRQPGRYFRGPGFSPHNLYTRTAALFTLARRGAAPPPAFFQYRIAGQGVTAAGATPASHVDLHFPLALATWDWSPVTQRWLRTQNGTRDVDQSGRQVAVANVVIQYLPYATDGYATGEGIYPPPPIPRVVSVGQGSAIILTGGMMVRAHWSKPTPWAVTQYADAAGHPILLTPGQTWVELAPLGALTAIR